MRRRAALLAILLAAAGATHTARSGDCGTSRVPGATLLAPYFRVSRNGANGIGDIPDVLGQTDTLMAITNVASTGLIVKATLWTKYGKPVLSWNIPMTAFDVVNFRMRDVLNGKLNVNANTQMGSIASDPCGVNQTTGIYAPATGFGLTKYIRFPNPDDDDRRRSVSRYQTPAYSGLFRAGVLDSLDESGDVTGFTPGANVLDSDSRCAGGTPPDGVLSGDFSGYVTFDVVNYCTAFLPNERAYYGNDALATAGWSASGYTPNALMGDVFYVDSTSDGHTSSEPMVALEYDAQRADWNQHRTFYGRYAAVSSDDGANAAVPAAFRFIGDGREALGRRYGFRYLNDAFAGLRSWAVVFRSDRYGATGQEVDLCSWRAAGGPQGSGTYDSQHQLVTTTFNSDGNSFVLTGGPPGTTPPTLYTFLETQRIDLLSNGDINPGGWKGGWIDVTLPGSPLAQAYVSVQHSGHAAFLSGGAGATLLPRASCAP